MSARRYISVPVIDIYNPELSYVEIDALEVISVEVTDTGGSYIDLGEGEYIFSTAAPSKIKAMVAQALSK